ncbi:uncharacterized protein [Apostichopus japonicus]|uniref:uncharacterized protein isoform X2 n=1 Tax=Stichopus japonicus TaxID=307972 RepID=UPI003AB1B701
MHRDELVIVLFTVVIMAEAKVCYRYQRLVNGHFRWAISPDNETHLCTSYRLGGVSLEQSKFPVGQDTTTAKVCYRYQRLVNGHFRWAISPDNETHLCTSYRLGGVSLEQSKSPVGQDTTTGTHTNGNTPPSSSQEAQSDSITDVSPSTSETIENAPRCHFFFANEEKYSLAKTTCLEIGGKMFGFEHLQANKTSSETFSDLMSTYEESSTCDWVWVDIIRNDEKKFEWSEGPVFELSDSWWGTDQPNYDISSEMCVASWREDNWKLHDVVCTQGFCTMCMDVWCNSN